MGSNFTCMFLMMIPINSESLMKFGELWKNVENLIIFLGPAVSTFFCEKFNFSEWAGISLACFWWWFQYVLQVWWNNEFWKKWWNFMIFSSAVTVRIFLWKNWLLLNRLKFHMHVFWWWFQYVLQVRWN